MKTAFGFIDLHGNPNLGKLTEKRPLGAVTFLGRYTPLDFILSNFSNSDINKTEILVERHYDSIRTHIGNGNVWIRNTKTGFIRAVLNEGALSNPNQNTDVANICENIPYDAFTEDFVVIASPEFIYTIDYREVIREHTESGAGISIVYTHTNEPKNFEGCNKLIIDKNGDCRKIVKVEVDEEECDVSLECYVLDKETFFGVLGFSREISNTTTTFKKMVELYTNNHMVNVHGYLHKGYVAPLLSFNQYVSESFKLLDYKTRTKLFSPDWPIYTTTHNTPPSIYGPNSSVSNCFIANGSNIKGKVKNSIISRDVIVEEGAEVNNCIIFSRTVVGEKAKIQYVVTDKAVLINNVKNLNGDQEDYLLIAKGAKI